MLFSSLTGSGPRVGPKLVSGPFSSPIGPETHFGPAFGPLPANDEKRIFDPLINLLGDSGPEGPPTHYKHNHHFHSPSATPIFVLFWSYSSPPLLIFFLLITILFFFLFCFLFTQECCHKTLLGRQKKRKHNQIQVLEMGNLRACNKNRMWNSLNRKPFAQISYIYAPYTPQRQTR